MLFGVGYTEIVIIVGGGLYLIGSKDLPHFARLAGRATGRAVSYVSALRNRAFSFAEETELNKLHDEIQASMQQLNALRSEMRSGVNIFKQGQTPLNSISGNLRGSSGAKDQLSKERTDLGQHVPLSGSRLNQTKEGEEPKQQELVRPYQSTRQLIDYGSKSTDSAGSLMDDFADEDLRLTLEETAREI